MKPWAFSVIQDEQGPHWACNWLPGKALRLQMPINCLYLPKTSALQPEFSIHLHRKTPQIFRLSQLDVCFVAVAMKLWIGHCKGIGP